MTGPRGGGVALEEAAERWRTPVAEVEEWVWNGRLPPRLACWSAASQTWRLDGRSSAGATARRSAESGELWLSRIDIDGIREASRAWIDGEDPGGELRLRLDLVWWCASAALPPLEAGCREFASWCSDARTGIEVARRHANISDWYRMLTDLGVPHNAPTKRTRVTVVFELPRDWQPEPWSSLS